MSRFFVSKSRSMLSQILIGFFMVLFVFTCAVLVTRGFLGNHFFKQLEEEKGISQAEMLATFSAIGLYADNSVLVDDQLAAILSRPEIAGVALYMDDGSLWLKRENEKDSVSELSSSEVKKNIAPQKGENLAPFVQGKYIHYYAPVKLISLSEFAPGIEQHNEVIGLAQVTISNLYFNALVRRGRLFDLASIVVAVFFGVLAAFWLARRLSAPVHELTKGAKRVTKGNLETLVSTTATGELAELTSAFNKMLESLREREHLMDELQQARKLEAIGTLAGGIAHDFNNILSGIIGHTEITKLKLPDNSPEQHNLNQVLNASDRAKDLVAQILTFSRQSQVKQQPLEASVIVKEAVKLLRASLPANIEIGQNIHRGTKRIMADPVQIHQIVMNLCTNAYHAMETTGGLLQIELVEEKIDADQAGFIPDLHPGDYLRLSVSDTGCGIDPDIMGRIFEPFFTTKEQGKGTGMGLSMVHGIVSEYGGVVTVAGEPGRGTTFDLYFPLLQDYRATASSAVLSSLKKGSGKILLVDDELIIVETCQEMLEFLGYDVTSTLSSCEALEIFQSQPDGFDLVVTDQNMPKMTGIELIEKILAIRPDLPIILATGYSSAVSKETCMHHGICEFITKPHSLQNLSDTIHKVLS